MAEKSKRVVKKVAEEKGPEKSAKKDTKGKCKKNIFLRILTGIGIVLAVFIIAVVGLVVGSLAGYVEDTELIDVENMRLNLTSFVYVEDPDTGDMIELEQLYDTENRIWVSSSEIPEHLKNAFVAIEDERFYKHGGIDLKRFTGAVVQYLSNDGDSSYGGSTITQQLIKNLTKDDEYSIKRKIQEVYRAFNLERDLSKDEILEYYLNTIYLSQRCNGVGSAAITYFGKEVSELSLAECAVLAGITQFPTKYDPMVNPDSNKERQEVILKKMLELGFITKDEYTEAVAQELVFMKKDPNEAEKFQSYFTDAVIDQVIEDLMKEYNYSREYASTILYNGGLRIYLAMDQKIQDHMDSIYADPSFSEDPDKVIPQSSMVIMDPYTGLVKALAGGRGEKTGNRTLNRATQTLRQPGSTIKPVSVYGPAIEYGLITPSSVVNDSAVRIDGWSPRNDDHRFVGRISVAAALRGSRNVPCVKICNYLTTQAAFDFLKNNLHVSTLVEKRATSNPDYNLSDIGLAPIALGGLTDGVSVLEMCAAYCVFPNGGKYIKPSLYTKVLDSEGKVVLEHKALEQIAMSETTAREMVDMLQGVVTGGTGTMAALPGMRAAGKTGTTSDNKDKWFIGFTPYYVGAVWFGYDQPKSLYGFGSNPAATEWRKVMSLVHQDLENKKFFADDTDDKYSIMLCADSGMRATPACRNLTSKDFEKGKVPTKRCTEHEYNFNKNDLGSGKAGVVNKSKKEEGFIDKDSSTNNDGLGSGLDGSSIGDSLPTLDGMGDAQNPSDSTANGPVATPGQPAEGQNPQENPSAENSGSNSEAIVLPVPDAPYVPETNVPTPESAPNGDNNMAIVDGMPAPMP